MRYLARTNYRAFFRGSGREYQIRLHCVLISTFGMVTQEAVTIEK